ncbi:hypothetical protein [Glycomyces buryatensis]|uniref:Uncharacterized protein n=1 Tax=Glycomyces buryatensis TaxID=2570927 RepID=A0A4S8Q564_9ACTN|nr:hypothetical protein [Glycomyces buryatensis]THV37765.1 hypothetical protein FAB82_20205 [Glycomyces buryatensis]
MTKLAALTRGRFSDGTRVFTVYASSEEAPDSFQVCADDKVVDIALVVSGLNTGELQASWGDDWRTATDEWKRWLEDQAFMAYYKVKWPTVIRTKTGKRTILAPPSTPGTTNTREDRQSSPPAHPAPSADPKVRYCNG